LEVYGISQDLAHTFIDAGSVPTNFTISTEIISTAPNDIWRWTPSATGKFTFIAAWNIARSLSPKFELSSVVWCSHIPPKMSCCLLRALTDRLLTRSRLKHFGIANNDNCVLCNTHAETINHLFFSCSFSAYIWSVNKLELGIQQNVGTLQEETKDFLFRFIKKHKISALGKVVMATTVWSIWNQTDLKSLRIFRS